jgi:hypothetical protein
MTKQKITQEKITHEGLEYRLGGLDKEPNASAKFIISKGNNALEIYALKENNLHRKIADNFKIDYSTLLGGAYYSIHDNCLQIDGKSTDFGGIPEQVAEGVAELLSNYFNKNGVKITENSVYLGIDPYADRRYAQIKLWKELGYDILNRSQPRKK